MLASHERCTHDEARAPFKHTFHNHGGMVVQNATFSIGDGGKVSFWREWSEKLALQDFPLLFELVIDKEAKVAKCGTLLGQGGNEVHVFLRAFMIRR